MAFPNFKDFEFRFGFELLDVARERDLKAHKYPLLSGSEHEDLGEMPQVFTISAKFPATSEGRSDFRTLSELFDEPDSETLFIPGRGSFTCFFRKIQDTSQAGEGGAKSLELEFVETLQDDLTIFRSPDELEDMIQVAMELEEIEVLALEIPPVESTLLSAAQALYNDALGFVTAAKQQVAEWQTQIKDIQDAVARPYNELTRLAADIEQTANQAKSLFNTAAKYADLPYTLAKRLRNTANILKSIGRRFLPPPVDRSGNIIGEQFAGRVLTHSVVSGDTLQSISAERYGSALMWECLAEANGIFDPTALAIGDILVLPDFGGRQPTRIEVKPGKTQIGRAKCAV